MPGVLFARRAVTRHRAASAGAGPTVVRSAQYVSGGTSGTVTLSLPSAPAVGNVLIAICSWKSGSSRNMVTPTGWTLIDTISNNSQFDGLNTFWKTSAGSGDTATAFNIGGSSNDYCAGIIYELSGANATTPINGHSIVTTSSNVTTLASTPVTPTVLNCLPIVATTNDGNGGTVTTPTGWTTDQAAQPSYHAVAAMHRNTVTADTSTAVTASETWSVANTMATAALLIAPA